MANSAKKQTLSQCVNPFVTIQLTSGALPRFLAHSGFDSDGSQRFTVTSVSTDAHKMPLPTAKAVLHKIKRDWPLSKIVG
ncbi:hypothetical protein [Vibrio cholerae]|uniref:hypothetical protein n=1 Tax=Vibrio cholerae TaxID=666 RepID=UPI0008930831|nr:hypothetical protein [Vibrio cholerae]OFI67290.1 hypothetical protein BFX16_18940 [Vibrio cholerae]OFI78359.1 hypothetical protein BFX15_18420 [Vibrio cholerae]